jgi:hypothetical protein
MLDSLYASRLLAQYDQVVYIPDIRCLFKTAFQQANQSEESGRTQASMRFSRF